MTGQALGLMLLALVAMLVCPTNGNTEIVMPAQAAGLGAGGGGQGGPGGDGGPGKPNGDDTEPSYDPATTVIIHIHGYDPEGYLSAGTFGEDEWDDNLQVLADMLDQPTWLEDSTAPNQIAATTYYGSTPPEYYSLTDILEDAAYTSIPQYALRVAKYIIHVLERAPDAEAVNLVSVSMGTEVARYLIEHDLEGLSSTRKITRWTSVVGVTIGNWAASNVPDYLIDLFEQDSPDIPRMDYAWIDESISSHTALNGPYYEHMIINQWIATDDDGGALTVLSEGEPNDGVNLCEDQYFWSSNTTLLEGMMPGRSWIHTCHRCIADSDAAFAGVAAMAHNNVRVTITLSRVKALDIHEGWLQGDGEFVFESRVYSPMAITLYGVTNPINEYLLKSGNPPMHRYEEGETRFPNTIMFDGIIPPGETRLDVNITGWELDDHIEFYNVWEGWNEEDYELGNFEFIVSTSMPDTYTLSNSSVELDLTATITTLY
ncbi:MAG: hypothetical protein QNJ78_10555 [Gammaproteobacteria bacterium]|nr:hypothetical protein [Gammaproteobacteria bacterium]